MVEIVYPNDDPEYYEGPDNLVIGTPHFNRLIGKQLFFFCEKTKPLMGMMVEGEPVDETVPFDCIEVLAKAAMAGKPFKYIPLRDPAGLPLGNLYEKMGVPLTYSELRYALMPTFTQQMIEITSRRERFAEVMANSLGCGQNNFPGFDNKRAFNNYLSVQSGLQDGSVSKEDVSQFFKTMQYYHGLLIEFYFMRPSIKEFREKNDGPLGFVVGLFHAFNVFGSLNGYELEAPPSWAERETSLPGYVIPKSIENILDNN